MVTFFFTITRILFIKFPSYMMELKGIRSDYAGGWDGDPIHTNAAWAYFGICMTMGLIILILSCARRVLEDGQTVKDTDKTTHVRPSADTPAVGSRVGSPTQQSAVYQSESIWVKSGFTDTAICCVSI